MCSVAKSHPTLCDSLDCGPPVSSVCGIFQARILEWVAMPSSRGSSRPRDGTLVSCIPCIGRQILYHCDIWKAHLFKSTHVILVPQQMLVAVIMNQGCELILWGYCLTDRDTCYGHSGDIEHNWHCALWTIFLKNCPSTAMGLGQCGVLVGM